MNSKKKNICLLVPDEIKKKKGSIGTIAKGPKELRDQNK